MNSDENILGFHIHEGFVCTGIESDPFSDTGMHYSKQPEMHPMHTRDMPDDFRTNPSGNSGNKIACGVIR